VARINAFVKVGGGTKLTELFGNVLLKLLKLRDHRKYLNSKILSSPSYKRVQYIVNLLFKQYFYLKVSRNRKNMGPNHDHLVRWNTDMSSHSLHNFNLKFAIHNCSTYIYTIWCTEEDAAVHGAIGCIV
jgi:hypothetical protein